MADSGDENRHGNDQYKDQNHRSIGEFHKALKRLLIVFDIHLTVFVICHVRLPCSFGWIWG
jgi:hypothetical protein